MFRLGMARRMYLYTAMMVALLLVVEIRVVDGMTSHETLVRMKVESEEGRDVQYPNMLQIDDTTLYAITTIYSTALLATPSPTPWPTTPPTPSPTSWPTPWATPSPTSWPTPWPTPSPTLSPTIGREEVDVHLTISHVNFSALDNASKANLSSEIASSISNSSGVNKSDVFVEIV